MYKRIFFAWLFVRTLFRNLRNNIMPLLCSRKDLICIVQIVVILFCAYFLGDYLYNQYATIGMASYYGRRFHKRKTASGKRFNMYKLTAAHRRLALGTKVKVINLENGRSVEVLINDRGPYVPGRMIDVSREAARQLGMIKDGLAKVKIEVVSKPK